MSFDPDVMQIVTSLTDRLKESERRLKALESVEYGRAITTLPNTTIYAPNITTLASPSYALTWDNSNGRIHYTALTASSGARAYGSAATTAANITWTAVALDTEQYDTDAYHNNVTNNTRMTIPTTATYLMVCQVNFVNNTTGTIRGASLRVNGGTYIAAYYLPPIGGGFETALQVSCIYPLTAADYVELCVYQNTGGNLNTGVNGTQTPAFAIYRLP